MYRRPGLYIWLGAIKIRIGASLREENYPGTIHSPIGIALYSLATASTALIKVAMTLDKPTIFFYSKLMIWRLQQSL